MDWACSMHRDAINLYKIVPGKSQMKIALERSRGKSDTEMKLCLVEWCKLDWTGPWYGSVAGFSEYGDKGFGMERRNSWSVEWLSFSKVTWTGISALGMSDFIHSWHDISRANSH